MRRVPFDIGTVHFTGIGGIGMSGIAEVMHNLGYAVQGSDIAENANVKRLTGLGVPVAIGHAAEHLGQAKALVISSAIRPSNPEVQAARKKKIPVVPRADMLAELMRLKWCITVAGTHGKTTTTSMIAALLDAAGLDPTVINGGIINAWGSNARLGEGEWMVVEADESDGTFVRLPAIIAVVTNIDPEHLDFFGDFEAEKQAFLTFIERVPFYGAAILCRDHPVVEELLPRVQDRKVVTYGFDAAADVRVTNMKAENGAASFGVETTARVRGGARTLKGLTLNMPGRHNVQNAAAAVAAALEAGIGEAAIRKGFAGFGGVKRRFTKAGEAAGITIIDDYAHHPVEIRAVLAAAREMAKGRIIAVVQPHRYTRLKNLFGEFAGAFADADAVIVAPVYPAGEEPIAGITHDKLAKAIAGTGKPVETIAGEAGLAPALKKLAKPGDMAVCLGAGSITQWAAGLAADLAKAKERAS